MSKICRAPRSHSYVVQDKTGVEDRRLSFKARGILTYLLSKPDHWTALIKDIANHSDKDGLDSVASGLKELEKYGYLFRTRIHGEDGRFTEWVTYVYENPEPQNEPQLENPVMAIQKIQPERDLPSLANRLIVSNELSNKQDTNVSCLPANQKIKKPVKKRTQLQDDFAFTAHHVDLAKKNGWPNPADEINAFMDYHQARGTLMLDWGKAFCTWLRNAKKFGGNHDGSSTNNPRNTRTSKPRSKTDIFSEAVKGAFTPD